MVERKETKQAQRTRKLILDSFFKLLSTRGYNEISVLDICDDALISRGTFYAYFEDKADILNFCTHEIIIGLDNKAMTVLTTKEFHAYYQELFEVVVEYLEENKVKVKAIFTNLENGAVMSLIEQYLANNFRHRIRDLRKEGVDISINEELVVTYFAGGCMNLIKALVVADKPYDKAQLAECFKLLVVDTFERLIK